MNNTDFILEVIKYLVPAILTFLGSIWHKKRTLTAMRRRGELKDAKYYKTNYRA